MGCAVCGVVDRTGWSSQVLGGCARVIASVIVDRSIYSDRSVHLFSQPCPTPQLGGMGRTGWSSQVLGGCARASVIASVIVRSASASVSRECTYATPELTRGNHKSQFHEITGELTPHVNSHHLSCSQWLQLPNPTARSASVIVRSASTSVSRECTYGTRPERVRTGVPRS